MLVNLKNIMDENTQNTNEATDTPVSSEEVTPEQNEETTPEENEEVQQ